jgi:hypothetical protein
LGVSGPAPSETRIRYIKAVPLLPFPTKIV